MTRWSSTFWIWVICLAAGMGTAEAQDRRPAEPQLPGVALAHALSETTGLAISPLLGAGAYGAYKYWRAAPEQRPGLPWYARPVFWIPALVLVGLAGLKDLLGTAGPAWLKKPLDLAELLENKLSGLLVAGTIVPFLLLQPGPDPAAGLWTGEWGLARVELVSWVGRAVSSVVLLGLFLGVFLVFHAIQVLIVLSPFGVVDLGLKVFRGAVLASVAVTGLVNPWLGAMWALLVVTGCWLLAGWAFRLTCFGTVLLWDWVTLARRRYEVQEPGPLLFLAERLGSVPVRTFGHLRRSAVGVWTFEYRPWGIGPRREVPLPTGNYEVGRGLLFPALLRIEGEAVRVVGWWPPRCHGHEGALCRFYSLGGLREVGWRRVWSWIRDVIRGRPDSAPIRT